MYYIHLLYTIIEDQYVIMFDLFIHVGYLFPAFIYGQTYPFQG